MILALNILQNLVIMDALAIILTALLSVRLVKIIRIVVLLQNLANMVALLRTLVVNARLVKITQIVVLPLNLVLMDVRLQTLAVNVRNVKIIRIVVLHHFLVLMGARQRTLAVNVQVVNQNVKLILAQADVIPMLAVNYQVGAEVLILVEDVIIAKREKIVVLEELLVALVLAEVPIVVLVMPQLTSAKIILNIKNSPLRPLKGDFIFVILDFISSASF